MTVAATRRCDYHMPTYARKPVLFVRGRGHAPLRRRRHASTWTSSPASASVNLGHAHPAVAEAVARADGASSRTSATSTTSSTATSSPRSSSSSLGGGVQGLLLQLGRGGRRGRHQARARVGQDGARAPARPDRHARRAASTAARSARSRRPARPASRRSSSRCPPGSTTCRFNDVAALEAAMGADVCAVMLEPVQGEGGVYPAIAGYLRAVRPSCATSANALLDPRRGADRLLAHGAGVRVPGRRREAGHR